MKKFLKLVGITALALIAAASLMGCRISPALIDTVYTTDADEVDSNPITRYTNDGIEDDDVPQEREEDTAEDTNTETNQAQAQQQNSTEDDSTYQETGNSYVNEDADDANHTGESNSADGSESVGENSDASGMSNGSGTISDDTDSESNDNAAADAINSGSVSDDIDNSDNTDETDQNQSAAEAEESDAPIKDVPKKVVTDATGTEQEIPEDVYTVTAVGAAAPIVAMVGGVGRLIATSESFVTNELGSIIIDNSTDAEICTWWSGDGSEGISDENFTALLQASPDVCFEMSGEATFSSEQITELQEHGIGYLVLPELSSSENLKDAVMIVAEALETNEDTGQSAVTIANEYCEWVNTCLSDAANNRKTLDYYSIYISEWRSDVTFSRQYDVGYKSTVSIVNFPESSGVVNGTGQGVAVASTDVDGQPFFEFWEAAGVFHTCMSGSQYLRADWYGYDQMYIFPYMCWFGIPSFSDESIYWPFDYFSDAGEFYVVHSSLEYSYPNSFGVEWPYLSQGEYKNRETHLGGSERFSAIVVADVETKEAISNSPQWKAGFLDGTSVEEYAIDIAGDYDIYVNPTGFDNWAEGSVDSPLEAYWILYKISGGISESRLISEVRSFYSEFYGITLSDSQIENIINQ